MTYIPQRCAGFDHFQSPVQTLLGDTHEPLGVGRNITDTNHDAGVAVPPVFDDGDVDIDDVAIF